MYKLCFYVPKTYLEDVKQALFRQGPGKIGDYNCCTWQTLGQGQFRPLAGSKPHLGQRGKMLSLKYGKNKRLPLNLMGKINRYGMLLNNSGVSKPINKISPPTLFLTMLLYWSSSIKNHTVVKYTWLRSR